MNIQIYRTNASSYQKVNFLQQEKKILEKIEGVKYIKSLKEMNEKDPFILITNTHTKEVDLPEVLLEKTILLIHPNSGHDNLKKEFIENSPFPIVIGNPIRSHAVVEYIMSCLFQHFTPIANHLHWSEERLWNRKLLRDQKVLIIGNGHIGKVLKNTLSHLCPKVKVFDPYIKNEFQNADLLTQYNEQMFEDVEVLIMAASLNENNEDMIDSKILKKLNQECLIINAARGKLIDEGALIEFLEKNPKAFSFLDVYQNEPFSPGYLNHIPNMNKTSHIAGVYKNLNADIISFEYHIIKEFLSYINQDQREKFINDYQACLLTSKIFEDQLV